MEKKVKEYILIEAQMLEDFHGTNGTIYGLNTEINNFIAKGFEIANPVKVVFSPIGWNPHCNIQTGGDKTYIVEMIKYESNQE